MPTCRGLQESMTVVPTEQGFNPRWTFSWLCHLRQATPVTSWGVCGEQMKKWEDPRDSMEWLGLSPSHRDMGRPP